MGVWTMSSWEWFLPVPGNPMLDISPRIQSGDCLFSSTCFPPCLGRPIFFFISSHPSRHRAMLPRHFYFLLFCFLSCSCPKSQRSNIPSSLVFFSRSWLLVHYLFFSPRLSSYPDSNWGRKSTWLARLLSISCSATVAGHCVLSVAACFSLWYYS